MIDTPRGKYDAIVKKMEEFRYVAWKIDDFDKKFSEINGDPNFTTVKLEYNHNASLHLLTDYMSYEEKQELLLLLRRFARSCAERARKAFELQVQQAAIDLDIITKEDLGWQNLT